MKSYLVNAVLCFVFFLVSVALPFVVGLFVTLRFLICKPYDPHFYIGFMVVIILGFIWFLGCLLGLKKVLSDY